MVLGRLIVEQMRLLCRMREIQGLRRTCPAKILTLLPSFQHRLYSKTSQKSSLFPTFCQHTDQISLIGPSLSRPLSQLLPQHQPLLRHLLDTTKPPSRLRSQEAIRSQPYRQASSKARRNRVTSLAQTRSKRDTLQMGDKAKSKTLRSSIPLQAEPGRLHQVTPTITF